MLFAFTSLIPTHILLAVPSAFCSPPDNGVNGSGWNHHVICLCYTPNKSVSSRICFLWLTLSLKNRNRRVAQSRFYQNCPIGHFWIRPRISSPVRPYVSIWQIFQLHQGTLTPWTLLCRYHHMLAKIYKQMVCIQNALTGLSYWSTVDFLSRKPHWYLTNYINNNSPFRNIF